MNDRAPLRRPRPNLGSYGDFPSRPTDILRQLAAAEVERDAARLALGALAEAVVSDGIRSARTLNEWTCRVCGGVNMHRVPGVEPCAVELAQQILAQAVGRAGARGADTDG